MEFSPFNPIHFYKTGADENGIAKDYAHIFAPSDYIIFEVLHGVEEAPGRLQLSDAQSGELLMDLSWNTYQINADKCVSFYEFRGLNAGEYTMAFGDWISNPICVTDDPEILRNTVLLQYSLSWNEARSDVYAKINGHIRYFEIRLNGGFKDSGWTFSVDNEQFETDNADIVELSAVETTEKDLTIGKSSGYPAWIGEKLSHILTCELIFIDGDRYSFVGTKDIADVTQSKSVGDMFVYTLTMRQVKYVNAAFEREIRSLFRKIPTNLRKVNNQLRKV